MYVTYIMDWTRNMAITRNTSIEGMVRLAAGDGSRLGYERLRLLEAIAATGSISQAARNLRPSYKAPHVILGVA